MGGGGLTYLTEKENVGTERSAQEVSAAEGGDKKGRSLTTLGPNGQVASVRQQICVATQVRMITLTHTPAFAAHLVEFCGGKLCWGGPPYSNRSVPLTHPAGSLTS